MRNLARKLGFFTAFIIPLLVVYGFYLGGMWNTLPLIFSFVILPFIDQYVGLDKTNISPVEAKVVGEQGYYRFITYMWTWLQLAFICWAAFAAASGKITTSMEWTSFVLGSALVTGGIGITVAHELGHRKSSLEKFYAKTLLLTVCYMHFIIEHNRGHHISVGTPDDPATARKNEPFYFFWVRSVFGGYAHAWKLEKESLSRKGRKVWSLHNNMLIFAVLPILFCAFLTAIVSINLGRFAGEVPVYFFSQSVAAFTLLELVNYVEHYGIQRREVSPGKFERVNQHHSWNASHLISNFFLFQLQRHSDHHLYAHKRYQILNHHEESPQLPFGYPTMIIIALCPPLWFSLMNTRLEKWESLQLAV
jgi:alkane 1-monooxygenase